jgi:hypothetical protein
LIQPAGGLATNRRLRVGDASTNEPPGDIGIPWIHAVRDAFSGIVERRSGASFGTTVETRVAEADE